MKLLAIDGNSIFNRAFYGIRLLSNKEGFYTNAIYGFLTILNKLKEETSPEGIAIAFDMAAPTFRHKMFDGYKSNRKGMPEELAQQLPVLKDLLQALGYKIIECEGWEADDILGTLSYNCEKSGNSCIIATGDRDSLQLVGDNTTVLLATTKASQPQTIKYDKDKIKEDYGTNPPALIDIKALMGDTSDCIPGVAGIGQKTACSLIQKFESLDGVYENIDSPNIKPAMRKKLIDGKDMAYLSRKLGEIAHDAPIDINIDDYKIGEITPDAAKIMTKLELFSIMKKMNLQPDNSVNADEKHKDDIQKAFFEIIDDAKADDILKNIKNEGKAYIYVGQNNDMDRFALCTAKYVYKIKDNSNLLIEILKDDSLELFADQSKPLYAFAILNGFDIINPIFDISLAGYLLDPSATHYDILQLAQKYGVSVRHIDKEKNDEKTDNNAQDMSKDDAKDVSQNENNAQSGKDTQSKTKKKDKEILQPDIGITAAVMPGLCAVMMNELDKNGQHDLFEQVEIPLSRVLADMEICGFEVDTKAIKEYGDVLSLQAQELQREIYELCGCEFNINSPKQLGEVLFNRLGLKGGKKTKTGYSTSAEVMEFLAKEHPVPQKVLEYRTLTKMVSTYCDGLIAAADENGRIHSKFNQTETRTGRISSTEPNLQNIPIRTETGREFRRFFRAKDGYQLVDADYSQIELRVLAHMANDTAMIEAFNKNEDIHTITASQVFDIPEEFVTPIMRSRAKAVNFGIVYGIGAFSLSKDIGVTVNEASQYINGYLNHYKGVKLFMEQITEQAKSLGYAQTIFGRRRYLPELKSSNHNMRAFGERVARNMPIQGTAADIIKIAMVRVYNRLKQENMKSKLILQVHDELLIEAPNDEVEHAAKILKEEMSRAAKLNVPLETDVSYGKTWFDAH